MTTDEIIAMIGQQLGPVEVIKVRSLKKPEEKIALAPAEQVTMPEGND
jgi:RNA-binding protein YhbY